MHARARALGKCQRRCTNIIAWHLIRLVAPAHPLPLNMKNLNFKIWIICMKSLYRWIWIIWMKSLQQSLLKFLFVLAVLAVRVNLVL